MTREPTIDHRSTDTATRMSSHRKRHLLPTWCAVRLLAWTAAMPLAACVNLRAYAAGGRRQSAQSHSG